MQNCQMNLSPFAWKIQQMDDVGKHESEVLTKFGHNT